MSPTPRIRTLARRRGRDWGRKHRRDRSNDPVPIQGGWAYTTDDYYLIPGFSRVLTDEERQRVEAYKRMVQERTGVKFI